MKITEAEETALDSVGKVPTTDPFGEACPACGRPHVFTYRDGSKVCEKCDEVVERGSAISGPVDRARSFWQYHAATKRYPTHCSIDVLLHAGALWITHAVGVHRQPTLPRRPIGSVTVSNDGKTVTVVPA